MPQEIGILALQGGFAKHAAMVHRLGCAATLVCEPQHLNHCDGLILPGGESTTMKKLIFSQGFETCLKEFDKPIFGTCAGVIVMAAFGWLDIQVERNGWGRQKESFQADINGFPGIFIRAPRITSVGADVAVLATLQQEPVLVQQGCYLGATFHPELSADTSIHERFISMIREPASRQSTQIPLSCN